MPAKLVHRGLGSIQSGATQFSIRILFLMLVGSLGVWLVFHAMGFNLLTSDVQGYWEDSQNWQTPFNPYHVPGYPLLIALLRFLSASALAPIAYLQLMAMVGFIVGIVAIWRIGLLFSGSDNIGQLAAVAFMLWPMVGLTYVVFPVGDSTAIALFLLGLYLCYTQHSLGGAIAWGLALLVHKAIWPFVGLCFLAWALENYAAHKARAWGLAFLVLLPLGTLWAFGAMHYHSMLWIVASNAKSEISQAGTFVLFSGVTATLQSGGLHAWVKGAMVLGVLAAASGALVLTAVRRYPGWKYGAAIALAALLLVIILNPGEIWASVRFGRLLALPAAGVIGQSRFSRTLQQPFGRGLVWSAGVLLYLSQLAFAWYMVRYFE